MDHIPREEEQVLSLFETDERVCTFITEKMKMDVVNSRFSALTAGCFDLKHKGHDMSLLHTRMYLAKKLAESEGNVWSEMQGKEKKKWMEDNRIVLIVAIASDTFIQRVKGKGRPVMGWNDRASAVSQVGWLKKRNDYHRAVDWVIIYGKEQVEGQRDPGELSLGLGVRNLIVCEEHLKYALTLEERYKLGEKKVDVLISDRFKLINPRTGKEYSTTDCIQKMNAAL